MHPTQGEVSCKVVLNTCTIHVRSIYVYTTSIPRAYPSSLTQIVQCVVIRKYFTVYMEIYDYYEYSGLLSVSNCLDVLSFLCAVLLLITKAE